MPILVEISRVVQKERIFKFRKCIFVISFLSPLGKGYSPLFEEPWISLTPKKLCAKVWLKLAQLEQSGEDLKIRPCIFAILVLSPLYLNKLGFPLFKDVSNQVWLKMAQ